MTESRRMSKSELFAHFAERFGIRRAEAGEFFAELQQLTEQESRDLTLFTTVSRARPLNRRCLLDFGPSQAWSQWPFWPVTTGLRWIR